MHPPRSIVKPHLKMSQFVVPSHNCHHAAFCQGLSILDILDTQRVCPVSLTTDSANPCSLLQEYHRIFLTGLEPRLSARRAHREPSWTRSRNSSWGYLHNVSQLYVDFTQRSSAFFYFFSDPTAQLGSTIQGPNTESDGCLFFQHRDRDSGSSFIYYTFQHRPRRACLLVCLFVGLLVCLFRSVRFFVPLLFTVQRPRLGFVIYLLFAPGTDPL